jgi:hypothetical protein
MYLKLFHFRNESVQWIADFLGNDDEETRGGALSSVMTLKILLRYVADPDIKNKIIKRIINSVKRFIGFQTGVAELMGVSQPTVSNVIKYVTGKIIDKAPLWIHFPQNADKLQMAKKKWQNKYICQKR